MGHFTPLAHEVDRGWLGHFTADAELKADFGTAYADVDTIGGHIDNFMTARQASPPEAPWWLVDLL